MIKNLLTIVGIVTLLTIGTAYSQTSTNTDTSVVSTNVSSNTSSEIKNLIDTVQSSGILKATNYAIEPYLTYAPKAPAGNQIGGGVLAIYNLSSYVGVGLGVDYLGQFSLVSGNATLKYPINVGKYIVKYASWLPASLDEMVVTPFALAGVGKPMSGTGNSGDVSAIADIGGYVQFGKLAGGKFNVGACWGEWINAGDYSGKRYHVFAGWSHGF